MPYLEVICVSAFNDAKLRLTICGLFIPRAFTAVIRRDRP